MSNFSSARKSGSLIITKLLKSHQKSFYDYKILLLKRQKNISFSGMYSFPGGMYEASDKIIYNSYGTKQNRFIGFDNQTCSEILKITTLRETFEECGLLIIDDNSRK